MRPMSHRGTFADQPVAFGRSALGSRLEYFPAAERADLLVLAGIHGEEPDTTVVLSRALRSLAAPPRRAAVITAANPDGLARGTRGNANGVDLNRNFPTADWQPDPITHRWSLRHDSEVELSPGPAPCSEPETAALIGLIAELKPRHIISLHGHLDCIEDPGLSPFGRWAAERSGLPLVESVGYATPGSMGTWSAEQGIPILTWEFAPEAIESLFHTQLPVLIEILQGEFAAPLGAG